MTNKLLTPGNVDLLAQLCATHGRLVSMWSDPKAQASAALLSQYRAYHGALGLLGWSTSATKNPGNRFAKHAQTRENR